MDEPLFCRGWNGEQELRLLTAIEENGYGNWYAMNIYNNINFHALSYRDSVGDQLNKSPKG